MSFLCLHKYGKWSKLSHGVKRRKCKKCNKTKKKNATSWNMFWCSHRERRDRRRKVIIFTCIKCGRQREKVK